MPKATLLVRRKGTAMVPDYEALPRVRRFHGWKHDKEAGDDFTVWGTTEVRRQGAWVGHDESVAVPSTTEYIRAIRDGDLWPADQATAQRAGVPFDPTFGGSGPAETKTTE